MPAGNWSAVSLPAKSLCAFTPATIGQSARDASPVIAEGKVSRVVPICVARGTVKVRGPLTELTVTVTLGVAGMTTGGVWTAGAGDVGGGEGMVPLPVPLPEPVLPPPPQALKARRVVVATATSDFDVFIV